MKKFPSSQFLFVDADAEDSGEIGLSWQSFVECTSPVTERLSIFTNIQKETEIVSVRTIFYVILNLCALSAMVWQKSMRNKCWIIIIIIVDS